MIMFTFINNIILPNKSTLGVEEKKLRKKFTEPGPCNEQNEHHD